jgi:hypothetical protein
MASEFWAVCGRGSVKSFVLAVVAVLLACVKKWRAHVARGRSAGRRHDRGGHATSHDRAPLWPRFVWVDGAIYPGMLANEAASRLELTNDCALEIFAASSVSVRGYSLCAAVLAKLRNWPKDTVSDREEEFIAALRPGLSTFPGSLFVTASSPHSRGR